MDRAFCGRLGALALAWAVASSAGSADAASKACPDSAPLPAVEIKVLPTEIRFVPGVARDDVVTHRIDSEGNPLPVSDGVDDFKTIGLTNAHFTSSYSYTVESTESKSGIWCSTVTKVVVTLGYVWQEIYIPREYMIGSCEYQAVLDHEMEHVRANQQALAGQLDRIYQLAQDAIAAAQPFEVESKDAVAEVAKTHVSKELSHILTDFEADRDARNAALDSPESYRAISDRCFNW